MVHSSISLRLLCNKVIFFLSIINQFDSICISSSCNGLLSLLICNKWLYFIKIIDLTFWKSQCISLIKLSPSRWQRIRCSQEHQLRHINDVKELRTIFNIKPHPVSIVLHSYCFKSHYFNEIGTSTCVPMVLRLIEIQESGVVVLYVIVIWIALHFF